MTRTYKHPSSLGPSLDTSGAPNSREQAPVHPDTSRGPLSSAKGVGSSGSRARKIESHSEPIVYEVNYRTTAIRKHGKLYRGFCRGEV